MSKSNAKAMDPKERRRVKNLVRELKSHRGLHTEYVSVYIPAGYEISKIIEKRKQRYS